MKEIPSVEKFMISKRYNPTHIDNQTMMTYMIEFAKLHVKAALKAALENVELKTFYDPEEEKPYEDVIDSSILNSYPEENIK